MLRLQVNRKEADAALAGLAGAVSIEMVEELRRYGARWEGEVKRGFAPGGRGNRGGRRLRTRTGKLRRSAQFRLHKSQRAVLMSVGGSDTPYAGIQEHGGVVRPKRGKYLTIPLDNALTASGALSGSYRLRSAGTRRTRNGGTRRVFQTDKGETFVYRSKRGHLLIGLKRKGRKTFDPKRDTLYVLKREVKIEPRLGAWDAARLDGRNGPSIIAGFEKAADRGTKKV